jgi:hypothetical protein
MMGNPFRPTTPGTPGAPPPPGTVPGNRDYTALAPSPGPRGTEQEVTIKSTPTEPATPATPATPGAPAPTTPAAPATPAAPPAPAPAPAPPPAPPPMVPGVGPWGLPTGEMVAAPIFGQPGEAAPAAVGPWGYPAGGGVMPPSPTPAPLGPSVPNPNVGNVFIPGPTTSGGAGTVPTRTPPPPTVGPWGYPVYPSGGGG